MPRKYVSTNTYSKHDPGNIQAALNLIKEGTSLRKAAHQSGINYSVLYRHLKKGDSLKERGGQTVLTVEEEKLIVNRLQICGDWGYPIDPVTLRLLVKEFLDRQGKVTKFKNNLPGRDFVYGFLKRHSKSLSARMCQNIKRARAAVNADTVNAYFNELERELKDVPPSHIVNYDETNLCDDPGKRLVITRRGCKYPERVMNSTKASISVMFAAAGDGKILPPYVIYKALNMYESWRVGGPRNCRYNRTASGWFDSFCFTDWVETVAVPYLKELNGVKYLIGDNLSSHLSIQAIKLCNDNQIKFIFLPSNSTHLTQPLDVAFFRPIKMTWRAILEEWKKGPGRAEAALPKDKFPPLLKRLCESLKEANVIAGFKKCGIVPLNRKKVLDMLPPLDSNISSGTSTPTAGQQTAEALDSSLLELLQTFRQGNGTKQRKKRTKVSVTPGKSVGEDDFNETESGITAPVEAGPSNATSEAPSTSGVTKPKKKKKAVPVSEEESSDDESDYSIQDSDKEFRLSSPSEEDPYDVDMPSPASRLLVGDFAVVRVERKQKQSFRLYVTKVIEVEADGYVGVFFKKKTNVNKFEQTDEEAFFNKEDILRNLSKPYICSSGRFKDTISFEDDLSDITLY